MGATGLQANWTGVQFNSTTFVNVDDVSFDLGGDIATYSGDADRYDVIGVALINKPTASIQSSNPAQFMGLTPGSTSTLTATHADAKLATGGSIVYTLANAVFKSARTNGPHATYGKVSADFIALSSDGVTSPLSFSRT